MDSLDAFVEQARQGSVDAFCSVVRLLQGRVRAYIRRFVFDRSATDDLAQETFLTSYRSLPHYRPEVPFDLWVLGIARHQALKYLRGEARRRAHEARILDQALADWCADRAEADASLLGDRSRELAALRTCLSGLSAESARLLGSFYTERLSSVEIARRTGRRESGVRVALMRLRHALRECIRGKLFLRGAQA
jgi:RNA polymerase sigma-70 factor (ECF subfamily)